MKTLAPSTDTGLDALEVLHEAILAALDTAPDDPALFRAILLRRAAVLPGYVEAFRRRERRCPGTRTHRHDRLMKCA